jgi:hypothetical protein
MKSMAKLSTVAFAALLLFASCAFAQDTLHGTTGSSLISHTPSAFLTLTLGLGDNQGNNGNKGNGNGCTSTSNKNQDGWGFWGLGGGNNGGCTTVPEGGTTLTYLSLAGLCCLGALVFRPRRSAALETRN